MRIPLTFRSRIFAGGGAGYSDRDIGGSVFWNLRQTYAKEWNVTGGCNSAGVRLSLRTAGVCDLNGDGVINAADVQIAINQALGVARCTNADMIGNGQCNVVDVQRVINASMGGVCKVGPLG